MPNPVDQDRLSDTLRGGNVIDIEEYRTQAGTRKTATPFIPDTFRLSLVAIALLVLFCFIFAIRPR